MNHSIRLFIRCRMFACIASALLGIGAVSAAELRVFTGHSFADIRKANAGQPFVVAFWSTACAPCAEEMSVFAKLHRAYPAVKVVLVAADSPELRSKVERFLARHDLQGIDVWQFSDEPEERLRFSVDHAWRGELPRAYFFEASGKMTTQSGVPDEKWATDWFIGKTNHDSTAPRTSRIRGARNPSAIALL